MTEINTNCAPQLLTGPSGLSTTPSSMEDCNGCPQKGTMLVYPNPVSAELTVELDVAEKVGTLKVTNIMGRTVILQNLMPDQYRYRFDVGNLAKGVYLVSVEREGADMLVRRVVVE